MHFDNSLVLLNNAIYRRQAIQLHEGLDAGGGGGGGMGSGIHFSLKI